MADNKNNSGWLIAAALLGAGIAGKAAHDSNKKKKCAERDKLEQERLEQERLARENSVGNKLGNALLKVFLEVATYYSGKADEARENAENYVSCKSDKELIELTKSPNSIKRNAAIEKLRQREKAKNPYGLHKIKSQKWNPNK